MFLSFGCNEFDFPPPSNTTLPLSIAIGVPGSYGLCMEDFEGVENVTVDITVNSVDVNQIVLDEVDFARFPLGNTSSDLFSQRFSVNGPITGLFTINVVVIFSCSSCCGGNGPEQTVPAPDPNETPTVCGSSGGNLIAGQPRFSSMVPAMDAATLPNGRIDVRPIFRGCLTCGCID